MNVIARLEFELAYYDSAGHRFNHYTNHLIEKLQIVQNFKKQQFFCLFLFHFTFIFGRRKNGDWKNIHLASHVVPFVLDKSEAETKIIGDANWMVLLDELRVLNANLRVRVSKFFEMMPTYIIFQW